MRVLTGAIAALALVGSGGAYAQGVYIAGPRPRSSHLLLRQSMSNPATAIPPASPWWTRAPDGGARWSRAAIGGAGRHSGDAPSQHRSPRNHNTAHHEVSAHASLPVPRRAACALHS